eukprot:Ihof_evm5s159 gene=Ihof_evmTU5s159
MELVINGVKLDLLVLVLVGIGGASVLLLVFLTRRWILELFTAKKPNAVSTHEEVPGIPPTPPDLDPMDSLPLSRKIKFDSFSYYLGPNLHEVLNEINGNVEVLIVTPIETMPIPKKPSMIRPSVAQTGPKRLGNVANNVAGISLNFDLGSTTDMVEPCLGMTEDGDLIMLEDDAIVSDNKLPTKVNFDCLDGANAENPKPSTILALIDLREFSGGRKSHFCDFTKQFTDTVLANNLYGGVVLRGVDEATMMYGVMVVASVIQGLTLKHRESIFLIEDGLQVFDQIADFINGVVLVNPTMFPNGRFRPRYYGEESEKFDNFMTKLNTEIAIRTDFIAFALEVVRNPPSAELQANFVSWAESLSFVGWISSDPTLTTTIDIKPLKLQLTKGGVMGMLDAERVLTYYDEVKRFHGKLPALIETQTPPSLPPSDGWDNFLSRVKLNPQLFQFIPSLNIPVPRVWSQAIHIKLVDKELKLPTLPENVDFRPWPSAITRGQRPIGEHRLDPRQEDQMLVSLSFLQGEGHLQNIADTIMLEVPPKSFTQVENSTVPTSDVSFLEIQNCIKDILENPTLATQAILEMFDDRVSSDLLVLTSGLESKYIKVWIASKRAFFFKNEMEERIETPSVATQIAAQFAGENRYLAMFEDSPNETNIYVATDHPCLPEAVLHCYFKSRGYTPAECILLEVLFIAQKTKGTVNPLSLVPKRIEWQLKQATYEELGEYILNTHNSIRRIEANTELTDTHKMFFQSLTAHILRQSRWRLLDELNDTMEAEQHVADMMSNPNSEVEKEFEDLFGQATIRTGAKALVFDCLKSIMDAMAADDNSNFEYTLRLAYLHILVHSTFQRVALKEICLKVMQKNPLPLPEEDQVTVGVEMLVSRDKIKSLFNLSSNQLGVSVFQHIRSKVVKSEIIGGSAESQSEKLEGGGSGDFFKRLSSGMFFTVPALLDLVLIMFTGSGVFSSKSMSGPALNMVNLSFLVVFSTMGGIMNSVARVCAYYFSQYSVPLMLAASVRRFTMGLILSVLFSIATFISITISRNVLWGIFSFCYTLTFSVFLIFMSSLFIMQTGNDYVVASAGPRCVMYAMLALLFPMVISIVLENVYFTPENQFDVIYIYYGVMFFATVYLIYSYRWVGAMWAGWPNSIHITKVADIEKLYANVVAKPKRREGESLTDHGKREKRWERRSRNYFMMILGERLNNKQPFKRNQKLEEGDPMQIIEDRLAQEKMEKILMAWYLMRTGQTKHPWASFQWDVLLKQALGDIKKKFSVEKLNRGGLLFAFEAQAIAFGWMYFFLIFIDRWVTLFSGNGIFVVLPGAVSVSYSFGLGWATIFMLLSAGTFELNLASISYTEASWNSARLGLHDKEGLLNARKRQKSDFYYNELKRFIGALLIVFIITSGCIIGLGLVRGLPNLGEAVKFYLIATSGYFGLLFGLFHKLFMSNKDAQVNAGLFLGCVLGLGTGLGLVIGMKDVSFAVSGLVVGGWIFGGSCVFLQRRNLQVHRGVSLSPTLMSSGQSWIGPEGLSSEQAVRDKTLEPLALNKTQRLKIRAGDAIGQKTIEIISDAANSYNMLSPVLQAAFPTGVQTLNVICEGIQSGRIKVYMVLEAAMQIDATQGYAALSEYDPDKDKLRVYIGTPSNVGADMMTHIVAEGVVHEYMESFGMSHYHAVIAEILLEPETRLPQRICYQLANMNGNALMAMRSDFGSAMLRDSALLANLSTQWVRLPPTVRAFIVDYMTIYYDLAHKVLHEHQIDFSALPPMEGIAFDELQEYMRVVGATSDELAERPQDILSMYVARSCLAYELNMRINEVVDVMLDQTGGESFYSAQEELEGSFVQDVTLSRLQWTSYRFQNFLRLLFYSVTADSRFGRELHFCRGEGFGRAMPSILCPLLPYVFWLSRQLQLFLSINLLWTNNTMVHFLSRTRKGLNREHYIVDRKLSYIKYYDTDTPITAFVDDSTPGLRVVNHFEGLLAATPKGNPSVISEYSGQSKSWRLTRQFRAKGDNGKPVTAFFHYEPTSKSFPAAAFMFRGNVKAVTDVTESDRYMNLIYDPKFGNIVNSTLFCKCTQNPGGELEEVQATYFYDEEGVNAPMVGASYAHPDHGWVLTVKYASSVSGEDKPHIAYVDYIDARHVKYRTHYSYVHPLHPTLQTMKLRTGNIAHRKVKVETPSIVKNDWYGLIEKTPPRSIYHYDLLLHHNLKKRVGGWRFGKNKCVEYFSRPCTTQFKRMELWTLWRGMKIEGVFAMELDELFLREEPILQDYWGYRDHGLKEEACHVIEERMVQVSHLVVQDTPNTRTHLQMRISDLQGLGCGGDASEITTVNDGNEEINREILQVLSVDSGTWPTGGGGVGACRRDLIDNLERVRWTAIAEIGTDSEMVQKGFQSERYVNAINYVPLWGLDMGTPNQHVLSDQPYGMLELKTQRTTDDIVIRNFVPLVKQMIYGMCQSNLQAHHQKLYAEMFVKLHLYFQEFDWLVSWDHEATKLAWYGTWFNVLSNSWQTESKDDRLLQVEMPTLEDLDALFQLIVRLLFPLAARLPRLAVVHASHHGIQALLGVIAKTLYGSSLIIWDHGILWRERLLALSSLPPSVMAKFVQIGFSGLTRLAATLSYTTADCVCPCTSIQNVQWEIFLGGQKYGNNTMTEIMVRKIAPVLNGMDVNRFRVNKSLEREHPTTVMLSHVNRIKDVMNAIEAAALIVHEWGLKEYHLMVYGSLESDPLYANECANAIVSMNLAENVTLCGLGNASLVLPQGWVFVNSSVSEGLPLAIGEAGLCGLPVVCTDVGGSREVLSDTIPGQPVDPSVTYGRIVPPRSPSDLAMAQLEIFGMFNGLEQIVDPPCKEVVSLEANKEPKVMLARMLDPTVRAKRRRLGLLLRCRVYKVFPISRYLREHEQQLWIAALQCVHWDLWQMVQRYVMPRRRVNVAHDEEDDFLPIGTIGTPAIDAPAEGLSELVAPKETSTTLKRSDSLVMHDDKPDARPIHVSADTKVEGVLQVRTRRGTTNEAEAPPLPPHVNVRPGEIEDLKEIRPTKVSQNVNTQISRIITRARPVSMSVNSVQSNHLPPGTPPTLLREKDVRALRQLKTQGVGHDGGVEMQLASSTSMPVANDGLTCVRA